MTGNSVWECEGLPEGWAQACNEHMDALLTASEFSADLFRRGGVTIPVRVCPHPIDVERFNLESDASGLRRNFGDVQTVFLVVSQWMPRKGVEDALMAFATEFRPDEPVALVMLTWRWSHSVRERNACKGYATFVLRGLNLPAVPPVFFIGDNLPPAVVPLLYRAADVLVLPSRGEAFGLPVFEAAACGRPSIVTGWGGMWDHIDDSCAYRVAYNMETVHGMGPRWRHYNAKQRWARPVFDDLRRAMREAHEDQAGTKRKGVRARKVAESLAPALMGPQMEGTIRQLLAEITPKG